MSLVNVASWCNDAPAHTTRIRKVHLCGREKIYSQFQVIVSSELPKILVQSRLQVTSAINSAKQFILLRGRSLKHVTVVLWAWHGKMRKKILDDERESLCWWCDGTINLCCRVILKLKLDPKLVLQVMHRLLSCLSSESHPERELRYHTQKNKTPRSTIPHPFAYHF
jgi:hypothetical protein